MAPSRWMPAPRIPDRTMRTTPELRTPVPAPTAQRPRSRSVPSVAGSPMNWVYEKTRCGQQRNYSTAVRPSRSLLAIAKKSPTGSTMASCGPSKNGSTTCANSTSAAQRLSKPSVVRANSMMSCIASWFRPKRRLVSKTSICPINPSGGPRHRSPVKPDTSRLRKHCSTSRPPIRPHTAKNNSTEHARFWSNDSPKTPIWLVSCAS